jgi:hypothetical protein
LSFGDDDVAATFRVQRCGLGAAAHTMATRNAIDPRRPDELPDGPPRKRAHPLFWLLVLVALFALGWSFYNHHAGESIPAPVRPTVPATHATPASGPTAPAPPDRPRQADR